MTRIVAHRGSSLRHPENTISAFAGAREEGADGLEFDVRCTADGHPVIHHDPDLADGRLISATNAGGLPSDIPSLSEVLTGYRSMWLNVEIKNDRTEPGYDESGGIASTVVDELYRCLDPSGDPSGELSGNQPPTAAVISSFDEATLRHAVQAARRRGAVRSADRAPTGDPRWQPNFGYLLWDGDGDRNSRDRDRLVESVLAGAAELGCSAIHPHDGLVDAALVRHAGSLGLELNVWTVDDPGRIVELAELGVAGIITNDPAGALRALGR